MPDREKVLAVIQCAMPMEAEPLAGILEAPEGEDSPVELRFGHPSGFEQTFRLGRIDGLPVLLAVSGIGLANAASATARALALVDAQIVIAAGTTGGLAREIEVGDIAAGVTTIYGAADATAFGYAPGQVPGMPVDYTTAPATIAQVEALGGGLEHPVRTGRVVSSDSFITAPLAEPTRERFPDAIGADMETCAMAEVAWSAGVDWVSLRAVSDLCGPSADQDFHMDSEEAARHSAAAVRAFLRSRAAS